MTSLNLKKDNLLEMKKKKVSIINELKQKKVMLQKKETNEAISFIEKTIIPELVYYLGVGIRKRRFSLDNNWTSETLTKIEDTLTNVGLECFIDTDVHNNKKLYVLAPIETIENNYNSNTIDFSCWNKFDTPMYSFIEDTVHNIIKPAVFEADSQNINNLIIELPDNLNNIFCLSILFKVLEENQIKVDFDVLNNPNNLKISWDIKEETFNVIDFEDRFSNIINFNNQKTENPEDITLLRSKLEVELNALKKLLIDLKSSLLSLEKNYKGFLLTKGNNLFQMNFNYSIKRYFNSVDLLYRYIKPMINDLSYYIEKGNISDNINCDLLNSIKELINRHEITPLEKLCTELIDIQKENKGLFTSIIKTFSSIDIKNNITDDCDSSYIKKLSNYANLKFNGMFLEGVIDEKLSNAIDFFYNKFNKESVDYILNEKNINFSIKDSDNVEYNKSFKNTVATNTESTNMDNDDAIEKSKELISESIYGISTGISYLIVTLVLILILSFLNNTLNLLL